jgi:acyl-CoA dehydrogenase
MHLFGLVTLGYMWCRMVEAARGKLATGANGAEPSMNAKLVAGRFFMERMLPETASHLARIQAGAGSIMELPAELF